MSTEADIAREIVTDWLGMFDPPPQIDFQQSEMLQAGIAHIITKLRAERDAAARDMRERALAAVEKLRIHAATNFKDANCQGQRGVDRTDALYDAYHAIRAVPLLATDGKDAT